MGVRVCGAHRSTVGRRRDTVSHRDGVSGIPRGTHNTLCMDSADVVETDS